MPNEAPNISLGRAERVNVLVATPLGRGGRGGIDRIMDDLRRELSLAAPPGLNVAFATTRGQGHISLSPFHLARSIFRVAALRIVGRGGVVHVNLSSGGSATRKLVLCRAARLLGVPYILHLHGSRFRAYFEARSDKGRHQIVDMFRGAAIILVLGEVWKAFLIGHMPDLAARIEILPNASRAPPASRKSRAAEPMILFLGEVGARKGVPQLVEALAGLGDAAEWTCVIAGNGEVEQTRANIGRRGLAGRVRLTGWLGPEAVNDLLATADILVLPSFDENLPMSVIEGMAHGLAVIATPVGAVEDIIDEGRTGLLVPVGDAEALSAALRRLLVDPALMRRLGNNASAFHREHLEIGPYLVRLSNIWRAAATQHRTKGSGIK